MSGAYYNEFDPYAAAWFRELIEAEHSGSKGTETRSALRRLLGS